MKEEKRETGTRFNAGKLRVDLVPADVVKALAIILTYGTTKYDDRNWEKGLPVTETMASLKRHSLAIESGEDLDPETGLPHVYFILCNAAFLTHFYNFPGKYGHLDDRTIEAERGRLADFEAMLPGLMARAKVTFAEKRRAAHLDGGDAAA